MELFLDISDGAEEKNDSCGSIVEESASGDTYMRNTSLVPVNSFYLLQYAFY